MKSIFKFVKHENSVELFPSWGQKAELFYLLGQCEKEYNSFCNVEIKKPYKARSTGKGSQNNKYWALVTQIANEIGEDTESVSNSIKERAISKGYPYHVSKITGKQVPESSTKTNTQEFSLLIEECYIVGAFLGIVFDESGEK